MMAKKDYYEVLGVSREASDTEIKKVYHKLVLKYHPDRHTGQSEKKAAGKKFKEISEAYKVLSDPSERKKYDQFGHAANEGFQSAGGGFEGFGEDPSSIFDIFKDLFGDRSSQKKSATSSERQPRKGEDILIKLNLSFKESVLGTTRKIIIDLIKACAHCKQTGAYSEKYISKCSTCKGKGVVQMVQRTFFGESIYTRSTCPKCQGQGQSITKKCDYCSGKKFTTKEEMIPIEIPRGIQGKQLRMKNAGNDGWYGAEKGDIYIEVEVEKHRYFRREKNDIHVTLPISFLDAILGNYVEAITMGAEEPEIKKVRVPAGTQSGDCCILKNQGCYLGVGRSSRGDFYIHFQVIIPRKLTEETKEILKRIEQKDWNPNRDFIKESQDILKE